MKATRLWALWQALVLSCAVGFTRVGRARFLEWVTGLALNVEEHTITQSLIGLNRPQDWKALESFAEYGSWPMPLLQEATASLAAAPAEQLFFGYRVWAGDDTKVHRSSKDVWGVCTFKEYSARCPNRASTVRAHNWVLTGALRQHPQRPPSFLPVAARLYFRQSQLPPPEKGPPIVFRTKCQLMVELARQNANALPGKHLLTVDGGYARRSVLRPLLRPEPASSGETPPRIDVITRVRCDACLHAPLVAQGGKRGRGQPRKWGQRLPPPRQGGDWPGPWQASRAYVYGQWREVRWKEVLCCWRALGHDALVKAVVAEVEGYKERFTLLSTAAELTGLQVVVIFCGRSREEDGIRELKQRLGWEQCRAWTRQPIERTTQALLVALTCLRLLGEKLEEEQGDSWWFHPPWNEGKQRPSVLDVERLLREHREEFQGLLARWVEQQKKGAGDDGPAG
jgi:DDE superfamily endonuclease